ncbi:SCP2 sterol-binding domain-containing protein [Conexibacter sp. SYSU D00693]|uniref:SCP2 sterol-binding domain-containing protein n=1 Tax=Conexibacter sp. SYSU D00693 TaxID=2812560 RepID=UPI00196A728E|nr:SCP2 sterol-binding domain-containing protein [Conexibacter sp. SYSU D00693]
MTDAPCFHAPVVGFRAWHLDDDGVLRAWTFRDAIWEPGVTTARCVRAASHRPPVADCSCGLYALSDPSDRRLRFTGDQVVGAIAAWGDLEVHRTGFRAEHACVVALAVPDRPDVELLERLERAAARHRVALVPAARLSAEAAKHGEPLPDLWGAGAAAGGLGRGVAGAVPVAAGHPPIEPDTFVGPARGIVPDAHLWLETALGCVLTGLTPQLVEEAGAEAAIELVPAGSVVSAGDRLGTLRPVAGGPLAIWSPVSGMVAAVNPRTAAGLGDHGPSWLVRLLPSDWATDAAGCAWGPDAGRAYAAGLAGPERGDPFLDVRLERLRAIPPVGSWADVQRALEAERDRPRFADADAVRAELHARVREALDEDAALRARLGRLGLRVAFVCRTPACALVLDLRDGEARLGPEAAAAGADLVVRCTAELLERLLDGRLDPAAALRRGDLRSSRPAGETLRALAVLKHLRVARVPRRRASWASRPRNADGPPGAGRRAGCG